MATKILINTTRYQTRTFFAGALFDTVSEAAEITAIASVGGQLVDSGTPAIDAAAERARQMRRLSAPPEQLDAIMTAAVATNAQSAAEGAETTADEAVAAIPGVARLREVFVPVYGYGGGSSTYVNSSEAAIAAGAAIDEDNTFFDNLTGDFDPVVLQVVLGTSLANVISGAETGALGAPVTFTLSGTRFGAAITASFTASNKGRYNFGKAFDTFTGITSDIDPGVPTHITTGKGLGLANPINAEATVRVGLDAGNADGAPTLHAATGTVIPAGDYNPAETMRVLYTPAV